MYGNADMSIVKLANHSKIWAFIHNSRSVTIPQVARGTHLSLPTVTRAVEYGLGEGILIARGIIGGERGRKAQVYTLNPDYMHFILIYLSRDALTVRVHNLLSETICEKSIPADRENILSQIENTVTELLKRDVLIKMTAAAIPGMVYSGTVIDSYHYPALIGVDMKKRLEEITNGVAIVENDMHIIVSAVNNHTPRLTNGITAAFLCSRSGYGSRILVGGEVLLGKNGAAGRLGELTAKTHDRNSPEFHAELLRDLIAFIDPHAVVMYTPDEDYAKKVIDSALKTLILPNKPEFILGRSFFEDMFIGLSYVCEVGTKTLIRSAILGEENLDILKC